MYEYFAAIAAWGPSRAINESSWLFAVVQAFHLVSLGFLAGSLLMVDLRLLGRGFSQQPLAAVARDARPWLIGSLVAMVATGVPPAKLGTVRYASRSPSLRPCGGAAGAPVRAFDTAVVANVRVAATLCR